MAFENKEISIKVVVDDSGALKAFNNLGKEIETIGKGGTSSFSLLDNLIMGMAQGIGQTLLPKLASIPGALVDIISSGADIADINDSFASMAKAAGTSSDVLVTQLQEAMGGTISKVDLASEAIKGFRAGLKPDEILKVTQAARQFAEEVGGNAKDELDGLLQSLQKGDDRFLKSRGVIIDNNKAFAEYAKSLGTTSDKLSEVGKAEAIRAASLKALNDTAEKGAKIQNDAADNIKVLNTVLKDAKDKFFEALSKNEGLNQTLDILGKRLKNLDFTPLVDGLNKIIKIGAAPFVFIDNVANSVSFLDRVLDGYTQRHGRQVLPWDIADAIKEQLVLDTLGKTVDDLGKSITDLGTIGTGTKTGGAPGGGGGGSTTTTPDKEKTFADKLKEALAADIASIGPEILSGNATQAINKLGGTLGSMLGNEVGTSLGATLATTLGSAAGPIGAIVGSIGGSLFGDRISKDVDKAMKGNVMPAIKDALAMSTAGLSLLVPDSIFGKESEGTTMRKAADAFFADAFDANRLSIIIDGELTRVKDLVFSGNQSGGLFGDLPSEIQGAFQGVGAGFEELLGITSDLGVNIGAVLANNVGGSLNNLQLLVESTGKSFEDLKGAVVESFLDGKLSIDEALSSLHGIEQVSQKGIPDGLGMVDTAFKNIMAAGTKGGRALIDALKDVGYEANELGIKDFGGLVAELKKRMPESAAEIDKLFTALRESGIGTIDQLTSATTEGLLGALGKLQEQQFPFAKAAEDFQKLSDKISELDGKNVTANVRLNVTSNFDGNTQSLQKAGFKVLDGPGMSL